MDLAIRQELLRALAQAESQHALLAIAAHGRQILVGCDLTCYETHIEAVDEFGKSVELQYSEINSIGVMQEVREE
jgi:hypothetical protein